MSRAAAQLLANEPGGNSMKKFAVFFSAAGLFGGLCFAQADAPQQQQQPSTTQTTATQQSTTTTTSGSTQTVAPMEIRQWKGTLVDMSCISGGSTGAAASTTTTTTSETTTTTTDQATTSTKTTSTETEEKAKSKEHRSRMKNESGENKAQCAASSSTTMFGVKLEDGSVVRFDSVGNTRTAEQLKEKKSWVKDLGEGKAIRAKVNGIMSGDKITVTSIN
jgi:hypothetical protein